nr:hypothetical protein [uncultured Treponema sp.]
MKLFHKVKACAFAVKIEFRDDDVRKLAFICEIFKILESLADCYRAADAFSFRILFDVRDRANP